MKKLNVMRSNLPGKLRVRRQPSQEHHEQQELPGLISTINRHVAQAMTLPSSAFLTLLVVPFLLTTSKGEQRYGKLRASRLTLSADTALIISALLIAVAVRWRAYNPVTSLTPSQVVADLLAFSGGMDWFALLLAPLLSQFLIHRSFSWALGLLFPASSSLISTYLALVQASAFSLVALFLIGFQWLPINRIALSTLAWLALLVILFLATLIVGLRVGYREARSLRLLRSTILSISFGSAVIISGLTYEQVSNLLAQQPKLLAREVFDSKDATPSQCIRSSTEWIDCTSVLDASIRKYSRATIHLGQLEQVFISPVPVIKPLQSEPVLLTRADEAFQQVFPHPTAGFWRLAEHRSQPFQFRLKPKAFCNQLTTRNEIFEHVDVVLNWRYAFLEDAPVLEYGDRALAQTAVRMPRQFLALACQEIK